MKSVLMSIQPYWLFLIIANKMGWKIEQEKTVEVRKNRPKAEDWDRTVKLYCSKDKKSFARIPKKYQPLMKLVLGKVIGEFVCDWIESTPLWRLKGNTGFLAKRTEREEKLPQMACLSLDEIYRYILNENKLIYGWHIKDLVIYDKLKGLDDFRKSMECHRGIARENCIGCWDCEITRPPQSWCYVESEVQGE